MTKVLVTGGAGRLGSKVVKELTEKRKYQGTQNERR
jgi:nucleoside-diphosphate-sugar epimerase